MKNLLDYINNEENINEVYFPYVPGPEASLLTQYVGAAFILFELWLTIFLGTSYMDKNGHFGDGDPIFGIKTIFNMLKDKFKDLKFKKQLQEMQNILNNDPEYNEWISKPMKQRKMKDLTPIIIKYRNDDNVMRIIKSIWDESKNNK